MNVRIMDDLRMFLRIHGMDIYDYDGEDLEKAEEENLQQIVRNQNNVFAQGVAIPFVSMDETITFCRHLPKGRIRESRLYRMKDRYYVFLILEEHGTLLIKEDAADLLAGMAQAA